MISCYAPTFAWGKTQQHTYHSYFSSWSQICISEISEPFNSYVYQKFQSPFTASCIRNFRALSQLVEISEPFHSYVYQKFCCFELLWFAYIVLFSVTFCCLWLVLFSVVSCCLRSVVYFILLCVACSSFAWCSVLLYSSLPLT